MAKTNWAKATKEKLSTVTIDDGFKVIGGSNKEPIAFFYNYTASKSPKGRTLTEGTELIGTYEGSYVDQYQKTNYKLRTAADGLVAISSCGQLTKRMEQVEAGATVKLVYLGKKEIESGNFAGNLSHQFLVAVKTE